MPNATDLIPEFSLYHGDEIGNGQKDPIFNPYLFGSENNTFN